MAARHGYTCHGLHVLMAALGFDEGGLEEQSRFIGAMATGCRGEGVRMLLEHGSSGREKGAGQVLSKVVSELLESTIVCRDWTAAHHLADASERWLALGGGGMADGDGASCAVLSRVFLRGLCVVTSPRATEDKRERLDLAGKLGAVISAVGMLPLMSLVTEVCACVCGSHVLPFRSACVNLSVCVIVSRVRKGLLCTFVCF